MSPSEELEKLSDALIAHSAKLKDTVERLKKTRVVVIGG